MNPVLKNKIKQLIPPFVMRLARRKSPLQDHWGWPRMGFGQTVRLPGGRRFHLRKTVADEQVFRQVFLQRAYSPDLLSHSDSIARFYKSCSSPVIVDAGANIGASAVWFALTYPNATILAIEPDRNNFALMTKNVEEFDQIQPINAAIASKSGTLELSDPGHGDWAFRTSHTKEPGSYTVDAVSVDEVLATVPNGTPFFFKIDIEGAESELFSEPSSAIADFPLVAIELHDWMLPHQANSRNFIRWHASEHRDLLFRGENAFSIASVEPREQGSQLL